jgi:hypothetical protein
MQMPFALSLSECPRSSNRPFGLSLSKPLAPHRPFGLRYRSP